MSSDYTPPRTVWRTLKGKPYVTVSPVGSANGFPENNGADFGPDTPGTQNSGADAALAALKAQGGGTVRFLPGKHLWTNYLSVNVSNVTLDFAPGAKIVLPSDMWSLLNGSDQNFPPVIWVNNASNVKIKNPYIDGSNVPSTFGGGILGVLVDTGSSHVEVADGYVTNINLWPYVVLSGGIGTITTGTSPTNVSFLRCVANASGSSTDGGGFKLDGNESTGAQSTYISIRKGLVTNMTAGAFGLDVVRVAHVNVSDLVIVSPGSTTANSEFVMVENFNWEDVVLDHVVVVDTVSSGSRGAALLCYESGTGLHINNIDAVTGAGITITQGTTSGTDVTISSGRSIATNGSGLTIGPISGNGTGNVTNVSVSNVSLGGASGDYAIEFINNNSGSVLKSVRIRGGNVTLGSGGTVYFPGLSSSVEDVSIEGVMGYNPLGFAVSTPAVPASGTAQVNTNPFRARVYITGAGTTTAYTITDPAGNAETFRPAQPGSLALSVGQEITLDPGASITITYTVAPTWKWYGL